MSDPFHKDSRILKHVRPSRANVWAHAILDSTHRVITIALYPRSEGHKSSVIIPIPDNGPKPKPGWYYNFNTQRFQETDPRAD